MNYNFEKTLFLKRWKNSIEKSKSIEDITFDYIDIFNHNEEYNIYNIHFYKKYKYYHRILEWLINNNYDVNEYEGIDEVGNKYKSLKIKFNL
jgi:hypothetical protein